MRLRPLGSCPECGSTNHYFMVRLSSIKSDEIFRCRPCGKIFRRTELVPLKPKVDNAQIQKKKATIKQTSKSAIKL